MLPTAGAWTRRRARAGGNVTQMHYAKKGIITPEMEYVAIRENEGREAAAESYAARLEALFPGRLYIELARRGDAIESAAEAGLIRLAYGSGLPLVATNPATYGEPQFYEAHDAMLCIAAATHVDAADRPRSSPQNWVKSAPMMAELFADCPEALANTLVVARRCAFAPPKRKPLLPSLAGDKDGEAAMLAEEARAGLELRLAPYGEPRYAGLIRDNLIDVKPDGSFRLDMSYFDYCTGLTMTNERFAKLFGKPVRTPDSDADTG